jgi:hypothetical protein
MGFRPTLIAAVSVLVLTAPRRDHARGERVSG